MEDHKNEKRVYRLVLTGGEYYNRATELMIFISTPIQIWSQIGPSI